MNIGRKLTIALDWDNVLAPCTELACQKMTQRGTPVSVEDVTLYSFANFPKELADGLMAIFKEPDFFDSQVLYPGAAEMVEELLAAGHEVVIASAMPPEQMGIRGKQICSLLPGVKESNVMLGSRKDLLHVDFLLDDADYNITSSPAKYPVLFYPSLEQVHGRASCGPAAYAEFTAGGSCFAGAYRRAHQTGFGRPPGDDLLSWAFGVRQVFHLR